MYSLHNFLYKIYHFKCLNSDPEALVNNFANVYDRQKRKRLWFVRRPGPFRHSFTRVGKSMCN